MKQIRTFAIASTFVGCFLGAGFVSGQELWQFFGSYGIPGYFGMLVSTILFFLLGSLILLLAHHTGIEEMDKLLLPRAPHGARAVCGVVAVFFQYGILIVTTAGIGALFHQLLGLPETVGRLLFCLVVCLVACAGVGGMLRVFSAVVPVLTVFSVVICVTIFFAFGQNGFGFTPAEAENPLLGNPWLSAVLYVTYNLFCAIGVLAPLGRRAASRRSILIGIAGGTLILPLIGICTLLVFAVFPESTAASLPMLDAAGRLHPLPQMIYAVLLACAMFGTSLSSLVGVVNYFGHKSPLLQKYRIPLIFLLGLVAFLCGMVGFSELIGTVYPLCGYVGIVAISLIGIHAISQIKNRKNKQ
ncbi:MAG: hypothetical protein IJY20_07915 [Clostridia bacterium]|nr:hypothetical protein [Clostridia bacterium]